MVPTELGVEADMPIHGRGLKRFLQAAQRSGQARETLTGRDIFLAALAIAWAGAANGGADSGAQPVLQDVLRSGWALST